MREGILTVFDVAKMLSLSPMTVYRLAKKGEIPAIKIGRCWRFTKDAIDKWLTGKSWEQRLDKILNKVWKRTENISEEKIQIEISKAITEVRKNAKARSFSKEK